MLLSSYLNKNNISQAAFAQLESVKPPQVTQWIKKEFIVIGDTLYSPRRKLNTVLNGAKANAKEGEE